VEASGQLHTPTSLPPEGAPATLWIGDWVGPRADLDAVAKREYLAPAGNRTSVVHLVA